MNSRLQKDQGCCLSSNMYEVAMHNRIHNSVIDLALYTLYSVDPIRVQCTMCAEFLGPEIGTEWGYCVLYNNSLGQG